ncbi:c-type cytochrome [Chitinophagaceae bacterium MMS25-I14]
MKRFYPLFILIVSLTSCEYHDIKQPELICGNAIMENGYQQGHVLFQNNCASCHNLMKDATGPALRSYGIELRSMEWVRKFLKQKHFASKDSLDRALREQYGMNCTKFPDLTDAQVDTIWKYCVHSRF